MYELCMHISKIDKLGQLSMILGGRKQREEFAIKI